MAPEMVFGLDYNSKVDVFSFSIMIFEILTGKFNPYKKEGEGFTQFVEFKVANNPHFRPNLLLLPKDVPHWIHNLLRSCWHHKPEKRPNFEEIMRSLKSEMESSGSVLIYIRRIGESEEIAEDFMLHNRTIEGLASLIQKNFGSEQEKVEIKCDEGLILTTDDVKKLKQDAMIIFGLFDEKNASSESDDVTKDFLRAQIRRLEKEVSEWNVKWNAREEELKEDRH